MHRDEQLVRVFAPGARIVAPGLARPPAATKGEGRPMAEWRAARLKG